MSNSYWQDRQDQLYQLSVDEIETILRREYQKVLKRITSKFKELIDEAKAEGYSVSDLYKMNAYYKLQNDLQNELQNLGIFENDICTKAFSKIYEDNYNMVQDQLGLQGQINPTLVKQAVNATWCPDGKNWSSRVWVNKAALAEKLQSELIDAVTTGRSSKEVAETLVNDFSVGYNEASRLCRTEMNFIQNQSTYDKYREAGIKKYRILSEHSNRTCDICAKADKVYLISQASVGTTWPPLHPNCRCTVVAVLD